MKLKNINDEEKNFIGFKVGTKSKTKNTFHRKKSVIKLNYYF